MPSILGANTLSSGYDVSNSLKVDDASNDYLQRSISSGGSETIWTASAWFKRSVLGQSASIYCSSDTSTNHNFRSLFINADDRVQCGFYNSGYTFQVEPSALLRDMSAWYHIVAAVDSTQGTAANRVKIFINGVLQTVFSTANYPDQNATNNFAGTDIKQLVSSLRSGSSIHNSGYIAELHVLDGVAKAASDFGEYDEDSPQIWKPKEYDGSYGTNGFYMEFKENGTSQNSSGLGADTSGNDNHFAVHNLTGVDQATDTCTNNFATFNPLDGTSTGTAFAFSEGNCKGVTAVDTNSALQSTIAVSSGKWYAEFKIAKVGDNLSGGRTTVGIGSRSNAQVSGNYYGNTNNPIDSYGKYSASAHYYHNNGTTVSYGSSFVDDDIIGVYLDLDNNKLYFSENGTLYSATGIDITAAASTLNGHYHIGVSDASGNDNGEYLANYGGCPAFTISSAVSDDNGYGSFEYSPNITGDSVAKKFYALCTKNLAEFG